MRPTTTTTDRSKRSLLISRPLALEATRRPGVVRVASTEEIPPAIKSNSPSSSVSPNKRH